MTVVIVYNGGKITFKNADWYREEDKIYVHEFGFESAIIGSFNSNECIGVYEKRGRK